ncbi:MAG: hypothetical protein BWY52_02883 [Chloroflexi bacterium ADurb.Bin325]|nr:MAG: hypothetical protein BWY52_02883 [Chloroflexi bacterium ADurb.Bin325]
MSNGARVLAIMVAAVVLALIGGAVYALWLIGAETTRVLAFLLLGGGLLVGLVWAAQFPLRAWRSNQQPERHVYHDRVREIHHVPVPDPAAPPALPALPAARPVETPPVYPELLRAAFLAGVYGSQGTAPGLASWDVGDDRAEWIDE